MKSGISRELRMRSRGINREPKNCSQSLRLKMKLISKEKRMLLQQRLNLTNKLMKRFKRRRSKKTKFLLLRKLRNSPRLERKSLPPRLKLLRLKKLLINLRPIRKISTTKKLPSTPKFKDKRIFKPKLSLRLRRHRLNKMLPKLLLINGNQFLMPLKRRPRKIKIRPRKRLLNLLQR